MNDHAARSLDRFLKQLDRRSSPRRGGISTAPAVLAVGLILGYQLLTRLVPAVWESLLPHGLEQAATFRGWPALVWRSAVFCHAHPRHVWLAIGATVVTTLILGYFARPIRFLVWLAAVGVIVVDAGILVVTLQTSMRSTLDNAGL